MNPAPKTVMILALDGVQLLDVSGPLDVFAEANAQAGYRVYDLVVAGTCSGPIRSSSGVRLLADYIVDEDNGDIGTHSGMAAIGAPVPSPTQSKSQSEAPRYGAAPLVDTFLIAGAPHIADFRPGAGLLDWVRDVAGRARRFGSVCSGAFVLAHAGLLGGRRITTHWAVSDQLADAFPDVEIDIDAIHMRDDALRTAAGVTAGLDLALSLVEEDLGHDIAARVSAQLVMFFKRPGGQKQFSRKGEAAPAGRAALQEIQRWVAAHPAAKHTVKSLAARMGISARHFSRLFRDEVGLTPGEWIDDLRVEAARAMLESGALAPKQVMARCGYVDIDTFRRAFTRRMGITPAEYRKRHVSTPPMPDGIA